jgi:hypothetical protein
MKSHGIETHAEAGREKSASRMHVQNFARYHQSITIEPFHHFFAVLVCASLRGFGQKRRAALKGQQG